MKQLSKDDVKHVADLVNLSLPEEEITRLSEMLSDTLEYIDMLNELDTSTVEETFQVTGLENVFQIEENTVTVEQDEALKNAPNSKDGKFVTKAVFER